MTDALRPVRLCMFSGASSLPIFAAAHVGLFARSGLEVDIELTRSSHQLMEGLSDGRYDIVHAAPGNFVEWRDRTGDPVLSWLGGTVGPLRRRRPASWAP